MFRLRYDEVARTDVALLARPKCNWWGSEPIDGIAEAIAKDEEKSRWLGQELTINPRTVWKTCVLDRCFMSSAELAAERENDLLTVRALLDGSGWASDRIEAAEVLLGVGIQINFTSGPPGGVPPESRKEVIREMVEARRRSTAKSQRNARSLSEVRYIFD